MLAMVFQLMNEWGQHPTLGVDTKRGNPFKWNPSGHQQLRRIVALFEIMSAW
jgi:hypothetical protein